MSPQAARQAFVDESFHESADGGFYVLAAAVFEPAAHDEVREILRGLLGGRRVRKLHWNEMDETQQRAAAKRLADVEGLYVVTVGSPVPPKRQERARAMCLRRLVTELHGAEVTHLVVESRTVALNKRDISTVTGARFALPKGTRFRIEHVAGAAEPLLWSADIVAGAVRARLEGRPTARTLLEQCIHELEVATDC
jgi:hypothetical protein